MYVDRDDIHDRFPLDAAEIFTFSQAVCRWNPSQQLAQSTFETFVEENDKGIIWGEKREYVITREVIVEKERDEDETSSSSTEEDEYITTTPYEDNLVIQGGWWKQRTSRLPLSIEYDLNRLKKRAEKEKKIMEKEKLRMAKRMLSVPSSSSSMASSMPTCSSSDHIHSPPPKKKGGNGCNIS